MKWNFLKNINKTANGLKFMKSLLNEKLLKIKKKEMLFFKNIRLETLLRRSLYVRIIDIQRRYNIAAAFSFVRPPVCTLFMIYIRVLYACTWRICEFYISSPRRRYVLMYLYAYTPACHECTNALCTQ